MSRWRRAAAPAQVGLEICVPGLAAKGHHLPHWNWDICRAPLTPSGQGLGPEWYHLPCNALAQLRRSLGLLG